ncbi:hypothetical protein [Kiloniella sp.]|uniref:hypothetical protein n=1 Tax=Kiloniella sp. TaxID=1938587 RepID=UPI003A91374A
MSVVGTYTTFISLIFLSRENDPAEIYYKLPVKLVNKPVDAWDYIVNSNPIIGSLVMLFALLAWLIPLIMAFDLFWIYFKVKKHNATLTQQQIKAFD